MLSEEDREPPYLGAFFRYPDREIIKKVFAWRKEREEIVIQVSLQAGV